MQSPRRVLIVGPSNIGDAVLAGDVLVSIHRAIPDGEITLVVGERAQAMFERDPRIHTLIDAGAFDSPIGRLKLTLRLWRQHPGLIVDLRHTLYPFLLTPLRSWRYIWQPPHRVVHMRERHMCKLRAQAPNVASTKLHESSLWASSEDEAHVKRLCQRWGLDAKRALVVISPGAKTHIKRWESAGFARVADRLIDEIGAQVVFSGEPSERDVLNEILGSMRNRAHSAIGLTTIRQAGALMGDASLVITNDSASLHLASAVRVPTIAIFGPTDERKYGPTSPQSRVIRKKLFCAPCEKSICRFSHECMRFIDSDEVYQAARQMLESGKFQREKQIGA